MSSIRLDCTQMTDRQSAHDYLAQVLELPQWYGRNLDALYDMLTGGVRPAQLELIHVQALKKMGPYGCALLETIQAAAVDCPDLELILEEETIF